MDKIYLKYEKQAAFYTVYIREAHPTDGWRMAFNDQFGIQAKQPTTYKQRAELASQCSSTLQLLCPMLIDTIDDKAAKAFAAFPDRLYIIDSQDCTSSTVRARSPTRAAEGRSAIVLARWSVIS